MMMAFNLFVFLSFVENHPKGCETFQYIPNDTVLVITLTSPAFKLFDRPTECLHQMVAGPVKKEFLFAQQPFF